MRETNMKLIFIFTFGLCVGGGSNGMKSDSRKNHFHCQCEKCKKNYEAKATCGEIHCSFDMRGTKKCVCENITYMGSVMQVCCKGNTYICFNNKNVKNAVTQPETTVPSPFPSYESENEEMDSSKECKDDNQKCKDGNEEDNKENKDVSNGDNENNSDKGVDNKTTNERSPNQNESWLIATLVILLLCVAFAVLIIVLRKRIFKLQESQPDEPVGGGLPVKDQPGKTIVTIYAKANHPEVIGEKITLGHHYEEIPSTSLVKVNINQTKTAIYY
ncbi:Hypothetical predicted protein [Pelobates cultripes]|uniref:Uncharacterized protein n=2 Tax=Pelobates cultripes TaxID=61616 RepID=A0AAD1SGK6_PELCU|nr:Hypothetical predicted protein [Pelobates cultripes]